MDRDEHNLPPKPPERSENFFDALGWTAIRFLPVALFFILAALAFYAGRAWLH